MANPQAYTHDALGTRTVLQKGDIADVIIRIDVDDHLMLARLPRVGTKDNNPKRLEDALQAVSLTNYHAEFSAAPAAVTTARSTNQNWIQLFKKTATVSNTQNAIAQYGMSQEFDYQVGLRMEEIVRDVEHDIISDQAMQASTPANGRVGKMAGMGNIIATNTDLVANWAQAAFETLALACVGTSGGNPNEIYLDAVRKTAAAGWTEEVTRMSNAAKSMITEVVQYNTKFGWDCRFHWHKHMPVSIVGVGASALALDFRPGLWEIKELLPLQREDIAYTGAGPAQQIMWSLTQLCGSEKANFAFVG